MKNSEKCIICGKELIGKQIRYCSKVCQNVIIKEYQKIYIEKNKEKIKKWQSKYRERNKKKIKKNRKKYYERDKEINKQKNKEYIKKNKEKIKNKMKKYYEKNKDQIINKIKLYAEKNKKKIRNRAKLYREKNREKFKKYYQKYQMLTICRLHGCMSSSIRQSCKLNNISKNRRKWEYIAGYNTKDLKEHLEKLFQPGMTWKNYGKKWHIDHVIPKSFFQFKDVNDTEFKYCWSLNNLQPLWAQDNLEKNKYLYIKNILNNIVYRVKK